MTSYVKLIIRKDGVPYDMTKLVVSAKWRGRTGTPSRSLEVTLLDEAMPLRPRAKTSPIKGQTITFLWRGKVLFRGMIMRQEQSSKGTMTITATDLGRYLSNNKDTFTYTDVTAGVVFKDVCERFKIPVGAIADTKHVIPELTAPSTTGWDVICDALEQTYKATGERFAVICVEGEEMQLLERRDSRLQWYVETKRNVSSYTMTKSIENIKTRLKLLSSEGEVVAEAKDEDLEERLGLFQEVENADDEMTEAQLTEYVKSTLDVLRIPNDTLRVNVLGKTDVITGACVHVRIPEINVAAKYYVDEDSHTFEGNAHTMDLTLKLGNEMWY